MSWRPAISPAAGVLPYEERLLIGYRGYDRDGRVPRYPFGHGLGFTSWTHVSIDAPGDSAPGRGVPVTVSLRNTGARAGRQVIQLYASRPDSSVERPVQMARRLRDRRRAS